MVFTSFAGGFNCVLCVCTLQPEVPPVQQLDVVVQGKVMNDTIILMPNSLGSLFLTDPKALCRAGQCN